MAHRRRDEVAPYYLMSSVSSSEMCTPYWRSVAYLHVPVAVYNSSITRGREVVCNRPPPAVQPPYCPRAPRAPAPVPAGLVGSPRLESSMTARQHVSRAELYLERQVNPRGRGWQRRWYTAGRQRRRMALV